MNSESCVDIGCIISALEAVKEAIDSFEQMYQESIVSIIEKITKTIKNVIRTINEITSSKMISYGLLELSIPDLSVSFSNHDCLPQGPPFVEQSIKEIAIENFKYNINRYKNSKFIKFFKREAANFIKEFIYAYILYWIFRALGMQ